MSWRKRCTPDDINIIEVNRPEILAVIKDRQCAFYRKLASLREEMQKYQYDEVLR